jgi:hypothetical protein
MDEVAVTPFGFDRKVARIAVRFNGFYLSVAFDGVPDVRVDRAGGLPWRLPRTTSPTGSESALKTLENRTNTS